MARGSTRHFILALALLRAGGAAPSGAVRIVLVVAGVRSVCGCALGSCSDGSCGAFCASSCNSGTYGGACSGGSCSCNPCAAGTSGGGGNPCTSCSAVRALSAFAARLRTRTLHKRARAPLTPLTPLRDSYLCMGRASRVLLDPPAVPTVPPDSLTQLLADSALIVPPASTVQWRVSLCLLARTRAPRATSERRSRLARRRAVAASASLAITARARVSPLARARQNAQPVFLDSRRRSVRVRAATASARAAGTAPRASPRTRAADRVPQAASASRRPPAQTRAATAHALRASTALRALARRVNLFARAAHTARLGQGTTCRVPVVRGTT